MLAFAGIAGGAGAAIAGVFGKGLGEFLALEGALTQASVASGASAEQLGALREEVDRLGIVTSKAPAEIAQVSVSLAKAGFTSKETTAALEGITRASEATGESMQVVGDIIAKTVRTFGLAGDEARGVGDILVATANSTNTTVSGIGESLTYVGATAKASNQSLESIAIAIGLLGDAGIQGSTAGTSLVAAIDGLKQSSAGAQSDFKALVGDSSKAVEAFNLLNVEVRNSDGSMKDILQILPVLKASLGGLSKGDQDLITKTLFGVEGGKAILTLLNATDQRIQEVTTSVTQAQGQSQAQGEAMLQGLGGALNLLEGSATSTITKFGELAAFGLTPLVNAAASVLNGFLALPGPIQQVVVGTTALTGVLAAAIAVYTTYTTLQLADKAAKIASAAATATLSAATAINTIVTNASAAATAVMTGAVNKQNAGLLLEEIRTKGAAAAKGAYAIATGTASAATLAFAGRLALLAGQAALVVGAVYAVSQVFQRSEGAKFADDLNKSVKELEKTRGEADKAGDSVSGLQAEYAKFIDNIREKGPIEAVQIALSELTNSTGQFGNQLGFITNEQRGAQIAQLATADAIARLGGSTQDTTDLLAKFGQAIPDGRKLSPAELQTFTAAVAEQSKALQEEIEVLKNSKGQSAELDQQLDNEISIRESLIRTLNNRVTAQGGETTAVEAATDAAKALGEVLDELNAKYDQRNENADLTIDRAIADVATQEAEGLLSQAEAERQTLQLEATQLQANIDNNRALLKELNAQRQQRTDPTERADLDKEILKTEQELAKNVRKQAEERAKTRRDEAKAAEDAAKDAADAAKKAAEAQQKIAEEAAKKRADLLKQQQDDEARVREEGFGDQQRQQSEQFSAQQDAAKQAFDDQRQSAEAAFNDQQEAETASFEQAQRDKQAGFESKLRTAEDAFNTAQRDREEAFTEAQRAKDQAFSDRQKAEAQAFDAQQNAAKEAAEGRFAERRLEIERKLQIQDAAPEDRKALAAKFAEEDATAQRRQQAFAAVDAEEKAFQDAQNQAKADFEAAQREEARAFEEQQRVQQKAFDDAQALLAEAAELRKQQAQQIFEDKQRLAADEFEKAQEASKRAFEEESRNKEREFQLVQQNEERIFAEQQREAERAFKDEQRRLDRENAAAVQAILDSARPAQSLRGGGVAGGGVVQVHADEFLIPPRGTRVISQADSRRLVQEYMIANPLTRAIATSPQAIAPGAQNYSGIAEKLDTLISAVRSQRSTLQAGGNNIQIYGEADPTGAALRVSLDHLRMLRRVGG